MPTLVAVLSLTGAALADQASSGKILVNKTKDGLAIQNYDPVAYFTDYKPTKENSKIKSSYDGVTYYFTSAEHKALFDANANG